MSGKTPLNWSEARETAAMHDVGRHRASQRDARFRERIDGPIALLIIFFVAMAGLAGWWGARIIDSRGYFDPDPVRLLPDQRILNNLRSSDAAFIGAVALGNGSGDWLLARRDGQITAYDPATELARTEVLPTGKSGLVSPSMILAAGCGWNEQFDGGGACPDPNAAFVVSEAGGVLARRGGRWSVLLTDRPWIGQTGRPVEQEDVTGWASSADGRWVAVLAGQQGLGLYDEFSRRWFVPSGQDALLAAVASGKVDVVPDGSQFWLSSSAGLGRVTTSSGVSLEWSKDRSVVFRDFDVAADGRVLAIVETTCAQSGAAGCLSIVEVRGVNALSVSVGEKSVPAGLNDTTLSYAAMQGGAIVTIGRAGVHSYDMKRRNWTTLIGGEPDAFYAVQDGPVWVARGDILARFADGQIAQKYTVKGGPFRQIEPISANTVVGLGADGKLVSLPSGLTILPRDEALPSGASFASGASLGNQVLLIGSSGALLHDVAFRRFSWIPQAVLRNSAQGLTGRNGRLYTAAGRFWSVNERTGAVLLIGIGGSYPTQSITATAVQTLAAPLRSVVAGEDALWIVDAKGVDFALRPTGPTTTSVQSTIQAARVGDGRLTLAVAHSEGLIFADQKRFWSYRSGNRAWEGPFPGPPNQVMEGLAVGDGLFVQTRRGDVMKLDQNWRAVLDGGQAAAIGLRQLDDALLAGGVLYLAGDGMVQSYTPGASAFGQVWTGGKGPVRLVGVQGPVPIWLSGSQLRRGNSIMTPARVEGAWRVRDGVLARIGRSGQSPYTMLFPSTGGAAVCNYFGASAPRGRLVDAVELPDRRILAMTQDRAGVYDEASRRWIRLMGFGPSESLRLHVAGAWLLAVSDHEFRAIRISDIPVLDSCAAPTAGISWTVTRTGKSVVYDSTSSRVAILEENGMVLEWTNGRFTQVLAPSVRGPNPDSILAIGSVGAVLHAATANAIWSYDTGSRIWRRSELTLASPGGRVAEIDLADVTTAGASVTVWTTDGVSFGGSYRLGAASLLLSKIDGRSLPSITTPPAEIVDVSQAGGLWAVSSPTYVEFGRSSGMRLTGRIALPPGGGVQPTPSWFGKLTGFIVGSQDNPTAVYLLPVGTELAKLTGNLESASFRYAPGTDRDWAVAEDGGRLFRIDQEGRFLACDIRAGATARDACKVLLAAPLKLAGSDFLEAFGSGLSTYVSLRNGMFLLGEDWRRLVRIQGPAPTSDSRYLSRSGRFLMLDRPGGTLWDIRRASATALAEVVTDIMKWRGQLVIHDGDTSRIVGPDGPVPFALPSGGDIYSAQTLDWGAQEAFALDEGGFVVSESGERLSSLPVPEPDSVSRILPEVNSTLFGESESKAFWVQLVGGDLRLLKEDLCVPAVAQDAEPEPAKPRPPQDEKKLTEPNSAEDSEQGMAARGGDASATDAVGEAQPTPEPEPEPCWTEPLGARIDAGGLGDFMGRTSNGSEVSLLFPDGKVTVDPANGTSSRRLGGRRAIITLPEHRSDLQSVLSQLIAAPTGETELAPSRINHIARVAEGANGRPRRSIAGDPVSWNAMDDGWLAWERESGKFTFAADNGRVALAPTNAIVDGLLLPAVPGHASQMPIGQGFSWLTPQAIWRYRSSGGNPVFVRLLDAEDLVGLSNGRFLLSGRRFVARIDGQIGNDTDSRAHRLGALAITESLRSQKVSGRIQRIATSPAAAFGGRGFTHDQRFGIGWRGGNLVIATAAGLVPARVLNDVDGLPDTGRRVKIRTVGGTTYANYSGRWFRRDFPGHWAKSTNPLSTRVVVDRSEMAWTISPSGLRISAKQAADQWRVDGAIGLDFAVDQLLSVSGDKNRVILGTRLGTHELRSARGLSAPGAAVSPKVPRGAFDAMDVRPGRPVLYARGRDGYVVWDSAAQTWRDARAAEQPWRYRRAVDGSGFRADFTDDRAEAWRRLSMANGTRRMARFSWAKGGRMPFDLATAIFADSSSGSIWVGTRWGLRRFDRTGKDSGEVFDLRIRSPGSDVSAVSVEHVGIPDVRRNTLMASGPGAECVEISGSSVTATCSDPELLDKRLILSNALWTWVQTDGGLLGEYHFNDGSSRQINTSPQGRWPHDNLASVMECAGTRAELWSRGDILNDNNLKRLPLGLSAGAVLHCQRDSVQVGSGVDLARGAYVLGTRPASEAYARAGTGNWRLVTNGARRSELKDQTDGTAAYDAGRLRIRLRQGGIGYGYRTWADRWVSLPFIDGLPAIDKTLMFSVTANGRTDRLTPFGALSQRTRGGALALDPDTVLLAGAAKRDEFSACRIDRMERLDGRAQTTQSLPGGPLQFRCVDGRVYREDTTAKGDLGRYVQLETDPFARRILIDEPPVWKWELQDDDAGGVRAIDITFRGEAMPLSAGRLAIDSYQSMATPFPGVVDIVSSNGWWRNPSRQLGIEESARTGWLSDAAQVDVVTSDRGLEGDEPILCLRRGGAMVSLGADGRPVPGRDCTDWRGQGAFWSYRAPLDGPPIGSGTTLNAVRVDREISGGRFTDLVALGAPRPVDGLEGFDQAVLAVPVALGSALLDRRGRPKAYLSHPGKLAIVPEPRGGFVAAGKSNLFATGGGNQSLCENWGREIGKLAKGTSILAIERAGEQVFRLLLRQKGTDNTRVVSVNCSKSDPVLTNLYLDLSVDARRRYFATMRGQESATYILRVTAPRKNGTPLTAGDGNLRAITLDQYGGGATLAILGREQARGVLVLTESEAWLVDTDAVLSRLSAVTPAAGSDFSGPTALLVDQVAAVNQEDRKTPSAGGARKSSVNRSAPADDRTGKPKVAEGPGTQSAERTPSLKPIEDEPSAPVPTAPPELVELKTLPVQTIRDIQAALADLGYYTMRVDGVVGNRTRRAVALFVASRAEAPREQLTLEEIQILLKIGRSR